MAIEVDLYRSADYVRSHRIPLIPLLRSIFEPLLGQSLADARYRLTFIPVPDDAVLDGKPVMVNLRTGHDWVQVCIIKDGVTLYRHPHSVMEVIARPLQLALARREPDEQHWGFGIVGLGPYQAALVRPRPHVAMGANLRPGQQESTLFRVEEVRAPDPPTATVAELGVTDAGELGSDTVVGVVLSPAAHESLTRTMGMSTEVEEGGFLIGEVFGNADQPETYLVMVTAVIQAERTGASLLHFTFTGDSFTRVSEQIARRDRDEVLVGWYHTHLFPASAELGLSSIDVNLHADTFRQPWQIAGLVNIWHGERVVRFYASDHDEMAQMPYWVSAA
jgi:proteasome lid subunit RPN8/RPN11